MTPLLLLMIAAASQPVRVHAANPRYLEWRGKPLVLVTSAEHYGAVLNPDFDSLKYLDTLKADGMPYTRLFTGSYVEPAGAFGIERNTLAPASGRFLAPWARSDQPGYAGGGNRFDQVKWDAEYLKRLKAFLTAADERGVVVELTLFCSTYTPKQWAVSPFHPGNTVTPLPGADWKTLHTTPPAAVLEQQKRLTEHLVRELNGFDNLVYEVQNEPWADHHTWGETLNEYVRDKTTFPNRIEVTARESVEWQGKIADVVRATEATLPKKHLVFQNVSNFRLPINPPLDLFAGADAVHFHYAHPEAVEWNAPLGKPICCDETGFAGRDDATYRRQAWAFVMAGGALWNHLDYSFAVGKEGGTDVQEKSPGGGGPALRKQLRLLGEFVNKLDLSRAKPLPATAAGCVVRCLGVPGEAYAVYLRGRGPTELKLAVPAGEWVAEWIDVATGRVVRTDRAKSDGTLTLPPTEVADEAAVRVTPR